MFLYDVEATKEIGAQLHALGAMLSAHAAVRGSLGPVAARELEAAWSRVGEWL